MPTKPQPAQKLISFPDLDGGGALPVQAGPLASAIAANVGVFTADGANTVVVANTKVTAKSIILITIKTPAGTPSPNAPNVIAKVVGTSFSIKATAADTSVYDYVILG